MRDEILRFYDCTKMPGLPPPADPDAEVPITHIKVFHKRYPRLPRVALPKVEPRGELDELLSRRKSSRLFSDEPLRLEQMAELLASCRIIDNTGPLERRTYPSGGARFPVEVYPVVFRVAGLVPGCYHYDMEQASLELLWERDLTSRMAEFTSPYIENAAVHLVLTSVLARSEVKYGARAYPFSLIEAGHMVQNLSLTATRMGLGYCPIGGFVDDTVAECLDLTREEIPIYGLSVGWPRS